MPLFSVIDLLALAFFLCAWAAYGMALATRSGASAASTSRWTATATHWMTQMLGREMRMVDAQIVAALQNGTAFFASTSLIAVGGALTLLRSTPELLQVMSALPFGDKSTAVQWEAKSIGLAVIFVYAFFKFALVVPAVQLPGDHGRRDAARRPRRTPPRPRRMRARLGRLCEVAGRHFNRGQRAFFFALGYLGWFISPWLLMATSVDRRRSSCGGASSPRIRAAP